MTSLCREKWAEPPTSQPKSLVPWSSARTHSKSDDFPPDYKEGLPLYMATPTNSDGSLKAVHNIHVPYGHSVRIEVYDPKPKIHRRLNRRQTFALCLLAFQLVILWSLNASKVSLHKTHGCEQPFPFPDDTYANRIDKLSSVLPPDSLYVAEPGASSSYYTSISNTEWFLSERPFLISVDSNSSLRILVPTFELARAKLLNIPEGLHVRWVEWREDDDPFAVLSESLGGRTIDEVQVDGMVRGFVMEGLARSLPGTKIGVAGRAVSEIRERKEEAEINRLRCANQLTLASIKATRDRLKLGMTESQTHDILLKEMDERGLEDSDALVLFGENAALPHGSGTDRKLGKEDMILIDAGGAFGGYVADITRTFALHSSRVAKQHISQWESVAAAQRAAVARLSDNVTLSSVDAAARSALDTPHLMTHRLGHGVGLEGHEAPYLVSGPLGDKTVQSGMVFSVEPGVYDVKNGYGLRIEDCVVYRGDGQVEWLTGPVQSWGHL